MFSKEITKYANVETAVNAISPEKRPYSEVYIYFAAARDCIRMKQSEVEVDRWLNRAAQHRWGLLKMSENGWFDLPTR